MTEDNITPLRERMLEDMRIRGMGDKAQKSHIRAIKDFAKFLRRSPDTATPEELRAYQLHMTDTGVTASTFNTRIIALRFFFGMTCGREDMKRFMQFRTQPRKLPVVFSVEEVSSLLMATPGPGLKYRAALSISYGAGLRASEVCNLKISDIDSDRMLIHVDHGKGGNATTRPVEPAVRCTRKIGGWSNLQFADKPAFCNRSYCSRSICSHAQHGSFGGATIFTKPANQTGKYCSKPNRPFAAPGLNSKDADKMAFCRCS
ncbi:MAG: tyrosine-type recombinase/integrase [Sulfitobacter sp.]